MRFIAASMRPRPFSVAASTLTLTGPPRVTITSLRSSREPKTFCVMGASWVTITSALSPAAMTSSSLPAASLTSATFTCGSIGHSKSMVATSRSSPSSSRSASTIRLLSMWRSPATSTLPTLTGSSPRSRSHQTGRPPATPSPRSSRVVKGVERSPALSEAHLTQGPVQHARHQAPVLSQLDAEHPAQREPEQRVVRHDEHRPARVGAGEVREDIENPVGPLVQRLPAGEPVLRRFLEALHGLGVFFPDLR